MRRAGFFAALLVPLILVAVGCSAPVTRPENPQRRVMIPPPKVSVIEAEEAKKRKALATKEGPADPAEKDGPPDPRDVPENLAALEDPVPRYEPLSPGGNPKDYEVFGRKYKVLSSAEGFRETGLASWYGKKFHGRRTSNGERYDMFELTAAHKHLPLPTYARVTNLGNGKSVIVRINDRGPFHDNRIIDLSYAAATKLETVGKIAMVEIEAITPGQELPPPPRMQMELQTAGGRAAPRLLQVAAFSDPANAVSMRKELGKLGIETVQIRAGRLNNGDTVHRVMVGPFDERKRMDEMRIRIRGAGFEAFPISE